MDGSQTFFHSASKTLKALSDIALNSAKLCVVASAFWGTMLLLSYLARVGAPFPPIDASIGLFLNIFVAVFIFMMVVLFVIVYTPVSLKHFAPDKVRI